MHRLHVTAHRVERNKEIRMDMVAAAFVLGARGIVLLFYWSSSEAVGIVLALFLLFALLFPRGVSYPDPLSQLTSK